MKAIAGSPSIFFIVNRTGSPYDGFGAWFNTATATATVGTLYSTGTGVITCATAQAAANGYSFLTFGGHTTADIPNAALMILFADSNGGYTPTIGQQFYTWQISP